MHLINQKYFPAHNFFLNFDSTEIKTFKVKTNMLFHIKSFHKKLDIFILCFLGVIIINWPFHFVLMGSIKYAIKNLLKPKKRKSKKFYIKL